MGELSNLRAKEVIALANYLSKGKLDASMSKPDLETFILGRYGSGTIADAIRVLTAQGQIIPSLESSNAKALAPNKECNKLVDTGTMKSDGTGFVKSNCDLAFGHDGPCHPRPLVLKSVMQTTVDRFTGAKSEGCGAILHSNSGKIICNCPHETRVEGGAESFSRKITKHHKGTIPGGGGSTQTWPVEPESSLQQGEPLSEKQLHALSELAKEKLAAMLADKSSAPGADPNQYVTRPEFSSKLEKFFELVKQNTLTLIDQELPEKFDSLGKSLSNELKELIVAQKIEAGALIAPTGVTINFPEVPKPVTFKRRPHMAFMKVLAAVRGGLIPLMVGPAGSGKTTIAEDLAEALELAYYFQSCTAGMSEGVFLGRLLPLGAGGAMRYVSSPFLCGWTGERNHTDEDGVIQVLPDDEAAGVVLLDEVDAADANTTLVLNAALANNKMSVETRAANNLNVLVAKHSRSIVLMAANTFGTGMSIEYQGRGALDGAFLDRTYPIKIDYDPVLEASIAGLPIPEVPLWQPAPPPSVAELQDLAKWVFRVRERIEKDGIKKVWGTRALIKAHKARRAGIPSQEVKRDLLLGWPPDLAQKMLGV